MVRSSGTSDSRCCVVRAVQPAQPVRAADPHHPAMRQVDDSTPGDQHSLLPERVAIVRGDPRVLPVGRYGAGQRQERADRGHGAHRWHSPKTVR